MEFPQYRKYVTGTSYFKIVSEKLFEETQLIGKKKFVTTIEAKQYPEMLRIKDMLECKDNSWMVCSEEEYKGL